MRGFVAEALDQRLEELRWFDDVGVGGDAQLFGGHQEIPWASRLRIANG
jgi:hypothetical protein